jgi:two-component system, chemotaxis family, chemotaxis protein CheY
MQIDFSNLTILCADDSAFMRALLVGCLKALHARHIIEVDTGIKAMDYLAQSKLNPRSHKPIDLIIANWQMSPGDGISVLRWVRNDRDTPNRFMPFLLFTAHTDYLHVSAARDAGVTDIIAKPFSVRTLREKILGVVMHDALFIEGPNYFGPDRRRSILDFNMPDRRSLTVNEIETVYA